MNRRKKIIVISIIFLILILSLLFITNAYAIDFEPNDWAPTSTTTVTGAEKVLNIGNVIVGVIQTVASIISVAVLIVIGIKYMMGSVEEKAEYKKTLMPYIIGATLVFAAAGIAGIIYSIAIKI